MKRLFAWCALFVLMAVPSLSQVARISGIRTSGATTKMDIVQVRDTLVSYFSLCFDDGLAALYTDGWIDSMRTRNLPVSIGIIGYNSLHTPHGGTNYLSAAQLAIISAYTITNEQGATVPQVTFYGHGWNGPYGTTGGDAIDGVDMWRSRQIEWITSQDAAGKPRVSMGNWNSLQYLYGLDVEKCLLSFDSLGIARPRGWVSPNNAGHAYYRAALQKNGMEYYITQTVSTTSQNKGNDLADVGKIDHEGGTFQNVSMYPGFNRPRYGINAPIAESHADWLTRLNSLQFLKGAGTYALMHSPDNWEAVNGVGEFVDSFLDTLAARRDRGILRVVGCDEAYDLGYRSEISSAANWLNPLESNWNANATPDYVHDSPATTLGYSAARTWTSPVYADSVWNGKITHLTCGYGGDGYVKLWSTTKDQTLDGAYVVDASNPPYRWFHHRQAALLLPAQGGKMITVNFWARVDTVINGSRPSLSDTIGVTFEAYYDARSDMAGVSLSELFGSPTARALNAGLGGQSYAGYAAWTSYRYISRAQSAVHALNGIGSAVAFHPWQWKSAADAGGWAECYFTWKVPEWAQFVRVNFVKSSGLAPGAVDISNLSIHWSRQQ